MRALPESITLPALEIHTDGPLTERRLLDSFLRCVTDPPAQAAEACPAEGVVLRVPSSFPEDTRQAVIMAVGTRGDIAPYVGLGVRQAIWRSGEQVRNTAR